MAKKSAPARTPRQPRVNAVNKSVNHFEALLRLVDGPNTPASAVSEIADFVNATPAVQLPDITAILNSGHSASEKVERLREIVKSKI